MADRMLEVWEAGDWTSLAPSADPQMSLAED
jgi:hypothetical protein